MHRIAVAFFLACLALAACARQSAVPTEPYSAVPGNDAPLAAPAELARSVSAAPKNSSGRVQLATDNSLPVSLNTAPAGHGLITEYIEHYRQRFSPAETPSFGNGVPVAYKGYRFSPGEYSGALEFRIEWDGTSPLAANLHIALADFDSNSWQWFTTDNPFEFSTEYDSRFFSAEGEVYLVLLLLNDPAVLRWVRLGGNVPPYAGFIADSAELPRGPLLLDCTLDTFDVDGDVVQLAFDFDGDGEFELDNGAEPWASGLLETVGVHTISLRATDDSGLSAVASMELTVNDWQAEFIDNGYVSGFEIDADDTLHLCHSYYISPALVFSYSQNSGRGWDTEQLPEALLGDAHAELMVLDNAGTPVVYCSGDGQRLIQRSSRGWELLAEIDPLFDIPAFARLDLVFSRSNLPQIAAGTNLLPGTPIPAVPFVPRIRYWSYDGAEWTQEFDGDCDETFFGLALDDAGVPYLGYTRVAEGDTEDLPRLSYFDPEGRSWVEELITTEDLGHAMLDAEPDGTLHVVSLLHDLYYVRRDGEWRPGPAPGIHGDIPSPGGYGPFAQDLIVDNAGVLRLLRSVDTKLVSASLESDAWQLDTIRAGGNSRPGGAEVRVGSRGRTHVIGSLTMEDERYFWIHPQVNHRPRILHYWK